MIGSSYAGMSAVLYARVSTADKEQDTAYQIAALKKWCKENDVTVLDTYEDKITGTTIDRNELDRMLGRIMKGGVNMILALSEDRFTRTMGGSNELLKLIKPYGTVVRYLSDISLTPETEEGYVMHNLKTYGAQKYASGHSIKVKAGQARARANGSRSGKPIGRPSAYIDLDLAMECADKEYSVAEAAAAMKVGRETLRRKLIETDRLTEFYERLKKAGGLCSNSGLVEKAIDRHVNERRYLRSKTLTPDNTDCLNINDQKKDGA